MSNLRPALASGLRRVGDFAVSDTAAAMAGPAAAAALTLYFIIPTLMPGISSWDTAEFQTVGPVMGTAHPTGYPAYVILGWLASCVLQMFGDPAFRMNLLQAVLAAAAVAGTVAIVQILTGKRLIALAIGLVLACTQLFWRLSTHADPHMFHLALVAILFAMLITWDQRRRSTDATTVAHADRWLVASAALYGVAVANHSLALLLPPAIGLFVLAADWRVLLRGRTLAFCSIALVGTIAVLFAELPIRAMMHAPVIYGHPDTVEGFKYVVLAEQFRGSLADPLGHLSDKAAHIVDLMTTWIGPLAILGGIGLLTSIVRRPRYVILSGLSLVATCVFAASYANADIERYYLVPLLVVLTWAALGASDLVEAAVWYVESARAHGPAAALPAAITATEPATATEIGSKPEIEPTPEIEPEAETPRRRQPLGWKPWFLLAGEIIVAAALVFPAISVVPDRQKTRTNENPGGVSEAGDTYNAQWLQVILAPADRGGLPKDSVIVGWWSTSTTLWYGQKVLGMRPDIYIVDDRTRLDDNLGEVQDVFNRFLGNRPVFTIRLQEGGDGMIALSTEFDIQPFTLSDGSTIAQVLGRKGNQ